MNTTRSVQNIILLDDDPAVLFALKLVIQAIGYSVADFSKPEDALDYMRQHSDCDLFISDLRMPKINGLDVLKKSKELRPQLPFILMSAHATNEDQAIAQRLGCFGFLSKPFTPDDLNELVRGIELREAV